METKLDSAADTVVPANVAVASPRRNNGRPGPPRLREVAEQALSRTAGAPLIAGNQVQALEDARENYPRWLAAIAAAKHHIHFENYYIQDDETGREFVQALAAKAREGVKVRVLYDWLGSWRRASRGLWQLLRDAGAEVRGYNPPRVLSPLAWVSRDHRKGLVVDNEVGFVSGLCVAKEWVGDAARNVAPWRDTGVEIRGCAVAELERAFASTWSLAGAPLPEDHVIVTPPPAGDINLRIVSSEPSTAGMLRLDQLVASLSKERLWLTDAYFAGTTAYVQSLRGAARDGVDVRLLLPNATDIPLLQPLSRAGYRPLLEAGVRIFEWNGTMIHAKTAVADGRWARIGSTNLNVASWLGNCELDAVIEDIGFGQQMEAMYERDLTNSTEVVLDARRRVRNSGAAPSRRSDHGRRLAGEVEPRNVGQGVATPPRNVGSGRRRTGSGGVATAGAMRIGRTISAALTDRRELGPVEAKLTMTAGAVALVVTALGALFPRVLVFPILVVGLWAGIALLWRGIELLRANKK